MVGKRKLRESFQQAEKTFCDDKHSKLTNVDRITMQNFERALQDAKKVSETSYELDVVANDVLLGWACSKWGFNALRNYLDVFQSIPNPLPNETKEALFTKLIPGIDDVPTLLKILERCSHTQQPYSIPFVVFAPPVSWCVRCDGALLEKNKPAEGTCWNEAGHPKSVLSCSSWCKKCSIHYSYAAFTEDGQIFHYPNHEQPYVAVSSVTFVHKRFAELFLSAQSHCHVSFEGWCEATNEVNRHDKWGSTSTSSRVFFDRQHIKDLFFKLELENELREDDNIHQPITNPEQLQFACNRCCHV
eukprot:Lithocolla_globosa_v1_NODE_705_length_3413_cov_7.772186.p1 type:complete len:302 gc:universal NODE_705_length_3413_cov_7.772186:2517-1612(-)